MRIRTKGQSESYLLDVKGVDFLLYDRELILDLNGSIYHVTISFSLISLSQPSSID